MNSGLKHPALCMQVSCPNNLRFGHTLRNTGRKVSCEEKFVRNFMAWRRKGFLGKNTMTDRKKRVAYEDSIFSKIEKSFSWKQGGGANIV